MFTNLKLEIIDLGNTSGNPVLTRIYGEGSAGVSTPLSASISVGASVQEDKFSLPIITRGLGPSLSGRPTGSIYSDPFISGIVNEVSHINNNDWTGHPLQALFSTYGLNPPSNKESVTLSNPIQDISHLYYLYENITGSPSSVLNYRRGALDFRRVYQKDFQEYEQQSSGLSNAWLSYDVSTGATNKNLFAFSLEILDNISGLPGTIINPETSNGSRLMGYSGYQTLGANCVNVSLLLENTGITCKLNEADQIPEYDVCLTGNVSQETLSVEIQQILNQLTQKENQQGQFEGDPIDDSSIITNQISINYTTFKGLIEFNQPITGDTFCFNSYNYDYSGEYQDTYASTPPFPPIQKCWTFGVDYSGIDSLVSTINNYLSGSGASFHLWYKDICTDKNLSGYFETGGLLHASKISDNVIAIESMRVGKVGDYNFTFNYETRSTSTEYVNSLLYLRPDKITVQGADTYNSWSDLFTVSGIKWNEISPREIFGYLNVAVTGFSTGSNGQPNLPITPTLTGASGHIVRTPIADYTISGFNKCGDYFEKPVHFFSVPSGFNCNQTGDGSINDNIDETNTTGTPESSGLQIKYHLLKTGWKFKNETSHNYYRLVFDGLTAGSRNKNQNLHNEFFVSNINFYGVLSGSQIHSGETCILGGSYTGQYMGYTTGLLTGSLSGLADESGRICFDHQIISGVPNGNGNVQFNNHIGHATELFTGLVVGCLTGTGWVYDVIQGNFYNSNEQCVYFEVPVSGIISGVGQISGGPFNIITDSTWSGIKNTRTVHVTGIDTGLFRGTIPNFSALFGGIPSIGLLTGNITGVVLPNDSGYFDFSGLITGSPISGHSIALSGTVEARAVLSYNTPEINDVVYFNDNLIIYNTGSSNLPPTYFRNITELNNIINSGASLFGMTGYNDGTNIYLKSLDLGISGNSMSLSSVGSAGRPTFGSSSPTGGENIYFPITPSEDFTGELNVSIAATGIYTGLATGYLTGTIKQLDFIRYFSGIWNISSGDIDFRESGWITGGNSYQNTGFSSLINYSGHPDIIPLLITYVNSPLVFSTDLARLTITGLEMNSGLSMILSGQY